MIRTITMRGRTGLYDNPSFLITDNDPLTLKLNLPIIRDGKYVAKLKHGDMEKTVSLDKEMIVDVETEWLKKGGENPLEVFLELRDNSGTKVLIRSARTRTDRGGYFIEPLKIEAVDDGWSALSLLKDFESRICMLEQKNEELSNRIAAFEDHGVELITE